MRHPWKLIQMKRELQSLKVTPTNLLLSNCTFSSFELLNLVNDKLQSLKVQSKKQNKKNPHLKNYNY
jgi:hypothetical protein